jgi:acyl-[acyl-carrier-protein]-phospholipid O-acyltransferase/long-chain-fatty-acid--[acyl-carrier-protein] ligase
MTKDASIRHDAPLMFSRRFLPMFMVQFLGALTDNLFRNALFILVTFSATAAHANAPMIISLGAGLFILPFFLFSATAGAVVDRFEKTRLIQRLKALEFILTCCAGAALVMEQVYVMLGILFLLGVQAAFFGPVKYSILPNLVSKDELISANGFVEGGTFLAILAGTIAGSLTVTLDHGTAIVACSIVVLSLAGWAISYAITPTGAADPTLSISWRFLRATWPLLRDAAENKPVRRSILGISWFWFVGAIFLSVLPNYVKDVLGGEASLVTFLLTLFSVGIAAGSLWCNSLLQGRVDARYVPLAGIAMGLAIFALYFFSEAFVGSATPVTISSFIAQPYGIAISLSLFCLAAAGGVFTVPLYAIMQARSDESHRARIIAVNNIVNALFMVVSSLFTLAMFAYGYKVTDIFLASAIVSMIVAIYICRLLPQPVAKAIFRILLRLLYRVKVRGIENLTPVEGKGAVLVVNHTSLIDGILLAAFLPEFPTFAVNTHIARGYVVKLFLSLVDHYLIDPTNPMALKSLVEVVASGRHVVIFPEGRITMTGALMKIYEGPGIIAINAKAPIVPVRIDGAQYTPFSYLRGKVHTHWFPQIDITILPPATLNIEEGLTSRQRRKSIGAQLYDMMADMMFATCDIDRTLYQALLEARKLNGGHTPIIEDIDRNPMTYDRLVTVSRIVGRRFTAFTAKNEVVGVLLPNGVGVASVFFGLLAYGRVPAMLNFTSGLANMQAACQAAQIKCILTSRRFIELAKLGEVIDGLAGTLKIIYVEDIVSGLTVWDKIRAFISARFAASLYRGHKIKPDDAAAVLFTSGSEGAPKGVVLSHKNILANRYQLGARIDFNTTDIVFNALPVFHSFGLTAGLLLPVLSGVRTFLYPSPLHYRIISELVYDTNATILFGTDTFLAGYARMANAYDFYSVRYVFSGAERVKEETRRAWQEKFGLRILEGYGATEAAPVLAINTPMHAKAGTVGLLLPGIQYRLDPIAGVDQGGKLIVSGPNIMRGYLKHDKPGILQPPEDDQYDTGDIVEIDAQGFVKIVGRVKRFAKIAGEMVSLNAVEHYIQALTPDKPLAVVAVPHEKKGEELVAFVTHDGLTREAILVAARAQKLTELMVPRQILKIDALPVLGTGKTDYVTLNRLAREKANSDTA